MMLMNIIIMYPADFTYPDTMTNKMTEGVWIIEEELLILRLESKYTKYYGELRVVKNN